MIEIHAGGILIEKYWEDGKEKERDVTKKAVTLIWERCELAPDLELSDILYLLNRDLDIWEAILGNWTKELVIEGLSKYEPKEQLPHERIEYLELNWYTEETIFKGKHTLSGTIFPGLSAIGIELPEDVLEEGMTMYRKGDRITWGVSFTPVYELANLPIRLRNEYEIWRLDLDKKIEEPESNKSLLKLPCSEFSLGQILYGIVWELSFHGSPKDRDKSNTELKGIVADIKSGKEKLVEFKV